MKLGFEEASVVYESPSQNARVWTESWVGHQLFCPSCGAPSLIKYPNNRQVADFFCAACAEDYELKSQKGAFGRKIVDGAFSAMCARLASSNSPNLVLMNYDRARLAVTDLMVVPKQFFIREIIEERRPLKPTARRAGWIGCNILLSEVPAVGKVYVVRDGIPTAKETVLDQWRRTLFLRQEAPGARGWLIEVMRCVELIGRAAFTLDDVYAFEDRLSRLYPGNRNVRPKIRQQLQVLRDQGFLEFRGGGRYRLAEGA